MDLSTLLSGYADQAVTLVEPGGNYGDRLIYLGAERLVRASGIVPRRFRHAEFMRARLTAGEVVYIHGSGGGVPFWSGTPIMALRQAVAQRCGAVILGPTTFSADRAFVRSIFRDLVPKCDRVVAFARERVSHEILMSVAPSWSEVALDHDTALHLSPADLPIVSRADGEVLLAFRQDKESPLGFRYPDGAVDPTRTAKSFDDWLRMHLRAGRIWTNRLHSAIAGAIAGVPTTLFPNSYHKNRAVWEFSLAGRGIEWLDRPDDV